MAPLREGVTDPGRHSPWPSIAPSRTSRFVWESFVVLRLSLDSRDLRDDRGATKATSTPTTSATWAAPPRARS